MSDISVKTTSIEELDIPSAYKEAFALHKFLYDMGFKPENVSVSCEDGCLFVILETENIYFAMDVGGLDCSQQDFESTWQAWSMAFVTGNIDSEIFDDIWKKSMVRANRMNIVKAISMSPKTA